MLSRAAVRTSVDASFSGVLSGDAAQIPVHVPIDICGGTVDVIGELNPTFGNACVNGAHRLVPTEHLGDESAWSFPLVAGHSPSSSGTWWAGGGSEALPENRVLLALGAMIIPRPSPAAVQPAVDSQHVAVHGQPHRVVWNLPPEHRGEPAEASHAARGTRHAARGPRRRWRSGAEPLRMQ